LLPTNGRGPAIFVGDAPALDFLNSIATPVDATIDWIDDGKGLLEWLKQARLAPLDALETIRAAAPPSELDSAADQARRLREWFRDLIQRHMGRPLSLETLEELQPLNRLLQRDETFRRITMQRETGQTSLELETMRRWRSPEALLLPIGEALAQFVCTENFSNVKSCRAEACTLLFVDHTRGRVRRWCSMALCGNRAKQAAHRRRLSARH
jgi:predicted RNA-binding Zn ribbon-like protein